VAVLIGEWAVDDGQTYLAVYLITCTSAWRPRNLTKECSLWIRV